MADKFSELKNKMSPERQVSAAARTQSALITIALQELRTSLNITQEKMAEILAMPEEEVSRLENQEDMSISTLSKYATALGGKLKIVIALPDKEVVINQFEDL